MSQAPNARLIHWSPTTRIALALFCFTLLVFAFSPVRQITDSNYSMLLSQELIEHGSFKLDYYPLPRLEPMNRGYYISNGAIYQLELANNHIYYHLPPGTPVLSVPYVALMKLFGVKATNADGTYSPAGEARIEVSLAALLMATFAVLVFYSARLLLPLAWSTLIALGATFGTQVWSTASRAMWTDTWGLVLLGVVVLMLLALETGKARLNQFWPIWLATLLAWAYLVRPTNAVHIIAVTVYLSIYHRKLFLPFAITGAAWFAGFIVYSWHNYRQLLPSYYQSNRLNFSVFWTALAGNLISPARGLLIYVPALLFIAFLLARYWNHIAFQRLVVLSLGICVGHFIAVSGFPHWWGGHSYGPRFTTGLLPWLVLLSILGIEGLLIWRQRQRDNNQPTRLRAQLIAGGVLLMLSIFINARGALSHRTWRWNTSPIGVDEHPERLWEWREPQFLAGWVRSPIPQAVSGTTGQIDFSTTAAEKYLWYGWGDGEEHFRWTDGKEAAIVFALDPASDFELVMKFGPFLSSGKLTEQRVYLRLNGQLIQTLALKEEHADEYRLRLPKSLLREKNVLVFGLPDSNSPAKLGLSSDPRDLGIAMYWIQLRPINS